MTGRVGSFLNGFVSCAPRGITMLVGIVLSPRTFAPECVCDELTRREVERALQAVLQNAVLLVDSFAGFISDILKNAELLPTKYRQQILMLIEEIAKAKKRCIAAIRKSAKQTSGNESNEVRLGRVASELEADVIVCASLDECSTVAGATSYEGEVVRIRDFSQSGVEVIRQAHLQNRRLDVLPPDERAQIIGRALKYTRRVVLADKMLGIATKGRKLKWFVAGAGFVVKCWQRSSPYSKYEKLQLELITVAGQAGAKGGYVDPTEAADAIQRELRTNVLLSAVASVQITLKKDADPSIFADRFIEAKGRCYQIRHGLDDLGRLDNVGGQARPTTLCVASNDDLNLLAEIKGLDGANT